MIVKIPKTPITKTVIPIIRKIEVQLLLSSRLKPKNPPKTTRMATSGIIELIPSAAPRFWSVAISVSQALKQASLALEPKNVITQSKIITKVMQRAETEVARGKRAPMVSVFIKANAKIETPHKT